MLMNILDSWNINDSIIFARRLYLENSAIYYKCKTTYYHSVQMTNYCANDNDQNSWNKTSAVVREINKGCVVHISHATGPCSQSCFTFTVLKLLYGHKLFRLLQHQQQQQKQIHTAQLVQILTSGFTIFRLILITYLKWPSETKIVIHTVS